MRASADQLGQPNSTRRHETDLPQVLVTQRLHRNTRGRLAPRAGDAERGAAVGAEPSPVAVPFGEHQLGLFGGRPRAAAHQQRPEA